MKILFRVDGGEKIGLGHIMRTLVLANELKKNHDVKYICLNCDKYKSGVKKVKEQFIDVIEIGDYKEIKQIKKQEADVVIVDKYNIDYKYLQCLKEKFKIVYFDDNSELEYYPVDIILNQNVYGNEIKYNALMDTKLLLGTKYIMLRKEFRNSTQIEIKQKVKNVLITVGGSDDFNITENLIMDLSDLRYNLHIIVGDAFKFKDNLNKYEGCNIKLYRNANMCEIMKKCDVAISSCGSTLYELAFLGIPTLGITVADNQIRVGNHMDKIGAIKLSTLKNLKKDIINLSYKKRLEMSKVQQKLVDGKGVFRLKNKIEEYDK